MAAPAWGQYVDEASKRYNVPRDIIESIIGVESGGRPGAVSSAGAGGLMQLMPDTFAELRQRHGLGPDRFDPQTNINAGTAYVRQMYDQFGTWNDAFGAYNAGPGRWARVKAGTATAPPETRQYIPRVQAGIKETDVALNRAPVTEDDLLELARSGQMPGQTGLLNVTPNDMSRNYLDGLGLLGNAGQTPSQPPRTDAAALPGTTQTDRLGISDRLNSVMQQLLEPQRGPRMGPGGYMMAGALGAVSPLAATRDRKVGLGELLGALGGGLTQGAMAGEAAQRADLQDQLGNLVSAAKLQGYQQDQAQRAAQVQAARQLAAQLRQTGDPQKVALAEVLERDPGQLDAITGKQIDLAYPKPGEGFTVAPGEVRYDGSGRVIARGDPKPQDTTTQLSAAEVAALGLPVGTVAQRDSTGKVSIVNKPPDNPDQSFDKATKLRNEFTTQAKPLAETRQMYGRLEAAYNDQSGQADIALVYSYMKMLDPASVVREGEFATAENAGGIPDRFRQLYNRALNGERLPPQVRADMLKQGQAQYGAIEKQHTELENRYRDLAVQNGLDPRNVVIDFRGGVKIPSPGAGDGAGGNAATTQQQPSATGGAEYDYDPATKRLVPRSPQQYTGDYP